MATPNELHYHECPTTGCHKQWTCTGPCGRWYYKACEAHEAKPPAPAVAAPPAEPPDSRPPEQKLADAASYAEMEKRNAQLLATTGEIKPPVPPDTPPVPPAVEVAPPAAPVETAPASPEVSEALIPVEPAPPAVEVAPPAEPVDPAEPTPPGDPATGN